MIRTFNFRCTMLAIMLLAAALFAPARATAQDAPCRCKFVTIGVDAHVRCDVEFCWASRDGARRCTTIVAGSRIQINCVAGLTFYIKDCHGDYVLLTPDNGCDLGIGAGFHCCTVDACFDNDDTICTVINIRPSILDVCPCK